MNAKSAIILFLSVSLLIACNLTTPNSITIPTTIPTTPATSLLCATSIPPTLSPTVIIISPSATPISLNQSILDRASGVIQALKNQDFITLSGYVHPQKGVRFSPYAFVRDTDQVFLADKIASILADSRVFPWGQYSGSGASIQLSFPGFYSQFLYDVDFANAPQLALNHRLGVSTSMDNSLEFYPKAMIVEYYFPGFDPQFQGMDWRSLRLVFSEYNGTWYIVGIIHDQWAT